MKFPSLIFLVSVTIAFADKGEFNWTGIWKGTVGKECVTVCVTNNDYNKRDIFGSYYFVNKPVPTRFSVDSGLTARSWSESGTADAIHAGYGSSIPPLAIH